MPRVEVLQHGLVESTNDIARQLAREGANNGTLVLAQSQSKGRGRRSREWWDSPGESVVASLILRPVDSQALLREIGFVASLGAARALCRDCGVDVKLKWPNDLIAGGKKIGGILVEGSGSGYDAAVVGMGINVNQAAFPDSLAGSATSILMETGVRYEVCQVAEAAAQAVLEGFQHHSNVGFNRTLAEWVSYMYGIGMRVSVRLGDVLCCGQALGVDQDGMLVVRDDFGIQFKFPTADETRFERTDRRNGLDD